MNFNKRELNLIKKANEELQTVQANCSARLLDQKDIEQTIFEAKKAFNELDNVERKWIKKLVAVNEYSVPVSYKWSAKTSRIEVRLNHYGTLESIYVGREDARIEAYGGDKDIHLQCLYE